MTEQIDPLIGYSGFELFEECYGYNENACFIADTEASAHRFMQDDVLGGEYRIEPVTLSQIMGDYGCSSGEFAMEKEAFGAFRRAARQAGILFQTRTDAFSPGLTLVNVEGVKRHDDQRPWQL